MSSESGKKFKEWLKKNEISQEEFGKKIGYSRGYLGHIICGWKVPGKQIRIMIYKLTMGEVPVEGWNHEIRRAEESEDE